MNLENAKRVRALLDVQRAQGLFQMHDWAIKDPHKCGTAACVAGWTVIEIAGAKPDFSDLAWDVTPYCRTPDGQIHNIERLAQELLGLTGQETTMLFFASSEDRALEIFDELIAVEELRCQAGPASSLAIMETLGGEQ